MPFLTAPDGVEVQYELEGDGFPLVFTHGNMGFGQQFFLQTRILSKKHRCILHDLRGCGLSGKPEAEIYDTKIHSSDPHTILKELGVQKAIHLGHSFGGPISLQYYFDYPDEVAGLVFIGSYSAGKQWQSTWIAACRCLATGLDGVPPVSTDIVASLSHFLFRKLVVRPIINFRHSTS